MLNIIPVNIPGLALGKITLCIVCHFVAPKANDASLNVVGTCCNASFVAVIITGKHIILKVNAPANRDTPNFKCTTNNAIPKSP